MKKYFLFLFFNYFLKISIASSCQELLKTFFGALEQQQNWASNSFTALDWIENPHTLFHTKACREIKFDPAATSIRGQLCDIRINFNRATLNKNESWNIFQQSVAEKYTCFPVLCDANSIKQFVTERYSLNRDGHQVQVGCFNPNLQWTPFDSASMSILLTIFALSFISTIYDIIMRNFDREPKKVLIAFSLNTNIKKIFDLTPSNSKSSFNSLHGIRSFSIFLVILLHRRAYLLNVYGQMSPFQHKAIFFGRFAVDTFFVMGGALQTISILKSIDNNNLGILRRLWTRYLRYTPALIGACFLHSLNPYVVEDFHLSDRLLSQRGFIQQYFRIFPLQIQNYYYSDHLWYPAADFQYSCFTLILLKLIGKHSKKTLIVLGLVAAHVCYQFGLKIWLKGTYSFIMFDFASQNRVQPWLVGIILGFALHHKWINRISVTKLREICLWIISAILFYIVFHYHDRKDELHFLSYVYFATHHLLWGCIVAILIFGCERLKSGKVLHDFLAHPLWKPISNISLGIYLTHMIVVYSNMTVRYEKCFYPFWCLFTSFCGDLVPTFALAIFLNVFFEMPFSIIDDCLYKKFFQNKTIEKLRYEKYDLEAKEPLIGKDSQS